MWKFTLLPGVVLCTRGRTAGTKGMRAVQSLLRRRLFLGLFGKFLHLLLLVRGREVDCLLRGEVGGARVAGRRRALYQRQVGLEGVLTLGDDRHRPGRLLGLVQPAGVVGLKRKGGERGVGLALHDVEVALPVTGRRAQVVLGLLGKLARARRLVGGRERVVVAHERLEDRRVVGGASQALLLAFDLLLELAVGVAAPAAARDRVE